MQNKALTKEKELLRSHVTALKEQLEAARGAAAPAAVLPPDLRTSAPLLSTPPTVPADSRASSPSGSILAAVPSAGNSGVRPLPLDMILIGGGGTVPGTGTVGGDVSACAGSSATTPQDASPWPGSSSHSGESGANRYMPPVCPSTAMAIPTPAPAASIRSPFAGTQHMLAATGAAAAAQCAHPASARSATALCEPSSLAQMIKSPSLPSANPSTPVASVATDPGVGVVPVAAAVAAALDTESQAPATRPLSPVAEGATEESSSSATGQGDSMPGLPAPRDTTVSQGSASVACAAAPTSVAGHDPPKPAS